MTYVEIGGGLAVLAFLVGLVWFSYRAGKSEASVTTSKQDTTEANAATDRVQAMAQAQADGPQTTAALVDRLDKGNA